MKSFHDMKSIMTDFYDFPTLIEDRNVYVDKTEPLPAPKDAKETLFRVFPELLFRRLTGQFAWR